MSEKGSDLEAAWNRSHHGAWMLHGHCYGTFPVDMTQKRVDVGVDCFGYTPIALEELEPIMAQRKFVPIDHHGMEERDDG